MAGQRRDVARWMMPGLFIDLARGLERCCFDYLIIEDSSNLPYTYQGTHDTYLKYGASTPKLDPAVLVPYLAQATKHLGLVPTLSVTEYPPFLLARLVNSLDHVTEGRVGWNCVTGSNDGGAQNYGRDRQYPHDERYDLADANLEVDVLAGEQGHLSGKGWRLMHDRQSGRDTLRNDARATRRLSDEHARDVAGGRLRTEAPARSAHRWSP